MIKAEEINEFLRKFKLVCRQYGCTCNDKCPLYVDRDDGIRCAEVFDELSQEMVDTVMTWKPPTDWSNVPVDTKILVRSSEDDEWVSRHFAGISKSGEVSAWADGLTSWTAIDFLKEIWKYAKLAEDIGK